MIDVALASCAVLPEPDPDQAPIEAAIEAAGLSVATWAWDDPAADFSQARCTVIRATWNYPWMLEEFSQWLLKVAGQTALLNPAPLIRWNLHKRYLLDLQDAGVPITPTAVLPRGAGTSLESLLAARGWQDVVVKPAVSAGSFRTLRVRPGELAAGEGHLLSLLEERDVLVQPYLPSVEGHGERALVWIDGEVTHAIRKNPRWQGEDESVSAEAMPISEAEHALAERTLAAAREHGEPFYARIDMAPGADGAPILMELELIEPSLFFPQGPAGLSRYVAALQRIVAG